MKAKTNQLLDISKEIIEERVPENSFLYAAKEYLINDQCRTEESAEATAAKMKASINEHTSDFLIPFAEWLVVNNKDYRSAAASGIPLKWLINHAKSGVDKFYINDYYTNLHSQHPDLFDQTKRMDALFNTEKLVVLAKVPQVIPVKHDQYLLGLWHELTPGIKGWMMGDGNFYSDHELKEAGFVELVYLTPALLSVGLDVEQIQKHLKGLKEEGVRFDSKKK